MGGRQEGGDSYPLDISSSGLISDALVEKTWCLDSEDPVWIPSVSLSSCAILDKTTSLHLSSLTFKTKKKNNKILSTSCGCCELGIWKLVLLKAWGLCQQHVNRYRPLLSLNGGWDLLNRRGSYLPLSSLGASLGLPRFVFSYFLFFGRGRSVLHLFVSQLVVSLFLSSLNSHMNNRSEKTE